MTDTATPPAEQPSIRTIGLRAALFLVPAAVVLKVYWSTLVFLVSRWEKQEEYSYCFLIPPVVAYLIWRLRRPLAAVAAKPSWHGAWPLASGLFLFWLGTLAGEYFTLYISLWLVSVGLLWLGLGRAKLKVMAFALAFALTMFPPPHYIHNTVTLKLQLLSSRLGVFLIQSFGLPAYREGNTIDLGFTQLQVVEACSGLNSAISLGVLGILIAYLYRTALWKRVFLVFSTLPLAIVTNSLRIALTGLIAKYLGTEYAQGFFHDFSGWLMFVLELPLLYLMMRLLDLLPDWGGKAVFRDAAAPVPDEPVEPMPLDRKRGVVPARGRIDFAAALRIGVAIVLILAAAAVPEKAAESKTAPLRPFSQFPDRIAEWTGRSQSMDPVILDDLDLTDYVLIDYLDGHNRVINFYTAYYASQSKGESIHSPATCYPGHGWRFDQTRVVELPAAGSRRNPVRVNAVLMEKDGRKQLMYYWFVLRGRIVTNYFHLKWFNFWDMLTQNRADGALVRLVTPVEPAEKPADAQQRLNGFAGRLLPLLEQFIPN